MSILETVRECRVAPPTSVNPRIPEKLERVAMKALERDPEVRYQDAARDAAATWSASCTRASRPRRATSRCSWSCSSTRPSGEAR